MAEPGRGAVTRTSVRSWAASGGARVLRATAPAKINIGLQVVGLRDDGFHELRSVFAPLELADELSVRVLAGVGPDTLDVEGAPDVPVSGNLVLRAAGLLRAEAVARGDATAGRGATASPETTARSGTTAGAPGPSLPPLAFRLRKRIPAAAGLGGGSSDALAALDLAAAAWGIRLAGRRRLELAAELGSDVPYFARGGWAFAGGRGERLRRLPPPRGGPLGVLLVVPAARLSTREVFAAMDATTPAGGAIRPTPDRALRPVTDRPGARVVRPGTPSARARDHGPLPSDTVPAPGVARLLRAGVSGPELADVRATNDLFIPAAVLLPGLAPLRDGLAGLLGRPVFLSGSGPTLVVLYPSPGDVRGPVARVRASLRRGDFASPGGRADIIATATAGEPARGDA